MKLTPCAVGLLAAACVGGGAAPREPGPEWAGPPVQVKSRADRGLEVELIAPTLGHAFELRAVESGADVADVRLVHRTPGDAVVAQVVTPLRVTVPAEILARAARVRVWIATPRPGASGSAADRLVFVVERP